MLLLPLAVAALLPGPVDASAEPVRLGIDVLLDGHIELLEGKRVGIVTNSSAVDANVVPTLDRLHQDPRVNLTQIFAPEHGLRAALASGTSGGGKDPETGLPIEGLFGKRSEPSKEALARVDVIVFDIQDIGSRTYTYITTLGKVMRAAGRAKVPVVVLDRPNPNGGLLFEGPIRTKGYRSLIGWGPFPVTHGLTVGEVARFYNGELDLGCDLTIVQMEGWERWMLWEDTGLLWVPTSPGIPHPLNAHLYVATGMVGGAGTHLSEGGGNSMPFELLGGSYIDPKRFTDALAAQNLPGVLFRPVTFRAKTGRHRGELLHGAHLMLTDARAFRPLRTALAMLTILQKHHGKDLKVSDTRKFGRVWGNDDVLKQVRGGKTWQQIETGWQDELQAFAGKRAEYLLYLEGAVPEGAARGPEPAAAPAVTK